MLTIDNPELEARLQERAARQGVPLDAYAVEVLRRDVEAISAPESGAEPQTPRQQAKRSGYGQFADVPGSVDDFLKERREENARETARGF